MFADADERTAVVRAAVGRALRTGTNYPREVRFGCGTALGTVGAVLAVPNAGPLLNSGVAPVGAVLAALGTLISLALVAVGYLLVARGVTPENALRITGWTLVGIAVLGVVVGLLLLYQADMGGAVVAPAFVVGNVLAVGAGAHVIIGVYDTQRVRADRLARERRRVAVLNRVLRHNLRNEATVLRLHAELLREETDTDTGVRSVAAITDASETLAGLADEAEEITAALEQEGSPSGTVDAAALAREAVDHIETESGADIEVEAPGELLARGGPGVRTAVEQLLDNSVRHGGERISVTVSEADSHVAVRVADDGPGIPETERAVVTGEHEITQLTHGSGLGLWVAKTVAECYRGALVFEDSGAGAVVTLELRAA